MKLIFTFIIMLISICSNGQKDKNMIKELEFLNGLINQYVFKNDSSDSKRNSEFILLFLKTDTAGVIYSINLMYDESNKTNVSAILKNMRTTDFREWNSGTKNNLLIIVPFYSSGSLPSYLDSIGFSPIVSLDRCGIKHHGNFVISEQVFYIGPSTMRSSDERIRSN